MHKRAIIENIERLLWLGVLLFLSLFVANAHAVIVVDNVSTVVDNNPTTLTRSHTTNAGSDRLMLVGVSLLNEDLESVTSVTYNGTGLNFVGQLSQGNDSRVEIWALVNPPVTTANVVINFNEQVQRGAIAGVITFTGVDQGSPYGAFQSNSGDSNTASATVTSSSGDLVFGLMAAEQQDSGPVVVGGTPQWSLKSQPGNNRTAGAGATFSGAGSVNLIWNMNEPDDWAIGAISLRDAAAPSSTGFCDNFESGLVNWVIDTSGGGDAGINGDTFNSASNSLYTRWDQVNVTSNLAVDASGTPYQLSLWIRRGDDGFSEDPDAGEDLQIQYFNNIGSWVTLETFAGDGAPGQIYERNYPLPADAQHVALRVRVTQTGGNGSDWDYWHVDDVCLLEVVQPEIEYRMDELSWNGSANEVVDSSGNGNDANANAASGLTTVNPGQICRAGDFDGVDDYIEASGIDTYLRDTSSMSFWIRTTQSGNDVGWRAPGITGVEESGGADDIFWGWLDASGRIGISVGNDYATKSTVSINDGNYHHVVLTRDAASGDYKIYIDGALDASGTSAAGVIGNGFSSIGRVENTSATAPQYFQGDLDEVLVFGSVLSDSAVNSIYVNQSNGRNLDGSLRGCAGSLAWFQLDADSGVWNGTSGEIVDQSGNFSSAVALGTGAGVDSTPAQVCRGIDIPLNTSNALQYGFDSGIDVDGDIGNRGSINFWYRSNGAWVGGGNRMLFDASPNDLPGADKYFFLMLQNNGRLRFSLEDSSDGDFSFQTGVYGFGAGIWTHIAVTWDMSGSRQVYVNGALAGSNSSSTTGQIGALRSLYFGDNRSSYHPGGSANSANGVIDEVRVYDRVQSQAEIVTDQNATHGCGSALARFVITPATTNASTCLPNAITIEAQDSSNNTLTTYSGTADISTSTNNGNWSVNSATNATNPNPDNDDNGAVSYTFDAADAGVVVLDLSNTHAQTLTVTVADTAEGVSNTSVNITFADNVFVIFEDPIQVAGRDQSMRIEMWVRDSGPSPSCGPDPNYNYNHNLDVSIDRAGVLPLAVDPVVNAVTSATVPDGPASASIQFDFSGGTGSATFDLATTDVGQYRLTITDNNGTHTAGPITGTSALLTVRPFGLAVTNIRAGANVNPVYTMPVTPGDPFLVEAGGDFEATVAGVLWDASDDSNNDGVINAAETGVYYDNAIVPSYAWDTTLDVSAAAGSFSPDPGTPGSLNNGTVLQGEFSAGSFTVTDLQYTEVGGFTLQSSAVDFLGVPGVNIVGDDIIVGRFRPADFDIVNIGGGAFAEGCGVFNYIGQGFSYATAPTMTVRALNALGDPTLQYRGGFNTLGSGSVTVVATEDTGPLIGPSIAISYSDVVMTLVKNPDGTTDYTLGADTYRHGPANPVSFAKTPAGMVTPFQSNIDPDITRVADAEISTNFPLDTYEFNIAGIDQRFGRLRMNNVHGSELNPLLMPVFTEYYDGAVFRKNTLDTCTTIAFGNLLLTMNPAGLSTPVVVNAPASAGNVDLSFPSPGAGNDGYVDATTDLNLASQLWLRYDWDNDGVHDNDPGARATFGIFDGDPVQIYIQQIYAQ